MIDLLAGGPRKVPRSPPQVILLFFNEIYGFIGSPGSLKPRTLTTVTDLPCKDYKDKNIKLLGY